jgi:hypothetical protein
MRRSFTVLAAFALTIFDAPWSSGSGLPSAALSTEDPCLVVCPGGDLAFHITLRDLGNNPLPGSTAWLDFSQCPGFTPCPNVGDTLTYDPATRRLQATTNQWGLATFVIHGGGVCGGGVVRMFGGAGVLLGARSLASPDQDGDLVVSNADLAILQSKVGSSDPTGDLDCDTHVTVGDVNLFSAHLGHTCASPTPVMHGSWGRLKVIHR